MPDPTRDREPGGDSDEPLGQWYRMAGIGMEFVVALGLFGGIGYFIDAKAGTMPWFMLAGFALGFAAGLYRLVKEARRTFHD